MNRYMVLLTRDYAVEIKAINKNEAMECAAFFVSGGQDASTEKERERYNFEILRIQSLVNEAFDIKKMRKDD